MEEREVFNMAPNDPLYVDPNSIPPGVEYRWIRLGVLEYPDHAREIQTKRMGFTPVPADRHPEMCATGWGIRNEVANNFITYRQLILCEIDKRRMEGYTRQQAMINIHKMDSLPGLDTTMSDPYARAMDFGSSRASRSMAMSFPE